MTACSALASAESLAGSAPHTRGWLILEHPGPYGRIASDALGSLGAQLREACGAADLTLLLARRPRTAGQRAWLALGGRMVTWASTTPEALLDLDLAAVDEGALPDGAEPETTPTLFVCTNGKRDACCALLGRPVAQALIQSGSDAWECSHLGGHRFAPTALLLPFGSVHGRLTVDSARALLSEARAGRCDATTLRGLSHLPSDQQVADAAVRQHAGIHDLAYLDMASHGDESLRECDVAHPDGREWRVRLRRASGAARPESCGKEARIPEWWDAESVSP